MAEDRTSRGFPPSWLYLHNSIGNFENKSFKPECLDRSTRREEYNDCAE
jgi:hypothetical protein